MNGRLIPRDEVTASLQSAMLELMRANFIAVDPEQFALDLDEKNWVVLIEDDVATLRGFSTLHIYEIEYTGEPFSVVYSGDTIIDRTAWSSRTLPQAWIAAVLHLRQFYPRGRYYWLLLSSGYRTYRFQPVLWREFFPRFDLPTPPAIKGLVDHLSGTRFGSLYDPECGIVRFPRSYVLRDDLRRIPPERLKNPHVAFFATRNPGHESGDELVSITELHSDNLTRAGRRVVREGQRRVALGRVAT